MKFLYYLAAFGSPNFDSKLFFLKNNLEYIYNNIGEKFDIILANINLNVILDNLKSIVLSSISNTYVLLSGFLLQDETELKSSITAAGLQYISTLNRGDWILVLAKKP